MKKLRVLLVDDEIMIREGFKRLFDWEAHDCEVVGEAADGMDALTKIDTPHSFLLVSKLFFGTGRIRREESYSLE